MTGIASDSHATAMDRMYRYTRHIYDLTRKYYLFGRDTALRQLAKESWARLIEVGPGTGRNLRVLHKSKPDARLGGVEASDAMLLHARRRCPWATLVHGFAESVPLATVLDAAPDRVLFSYCLSMVGEPALALENARRSITLAGEVVVVDFADLGGLPPAFAGPFTTWLRTFHVTPLTDPALADAKSVHYGPGRYFVIARFGALPPRASP